MDAIALMEKVAYAAMHEGLEISIEMKDTREDSKGAFGVSDSHSTDNSIVLRVYAKQEDLPNIEYDDEGTEQED